MKLGTHIVFGFAATLWIMRLINYTSIPIAPAIALAAAAITNWVIDYLGHEGPIRSPMTHSLAGSVIIAFIVTGIFLLLGFDMMPWLLLIVWLNCLVHYLLDIITTEGVQLLYPVSHRRYSIMSVRYDNKAANWLLIIAAVCGVALWYMAGYGAVI
jgi:membrane-bound metal-dependent hydrolase YbcI (DUF457 family)